MVRLTCMSSRAGSVNRRAGIDLKSIARREWRVARLAMRTRLGLPQPAHHGHRRSYGDDAVEYRHGRSLGTRALAGGFALRRRRLSDYSQRSWQRPLTIEGG